MPKIKVKLSEATSSKNSVKGSLKDIATSVAYSSSTTGVHAQNEMISIHKDYRYTMKRLKELLSRDAERIETLTVDFLEIDKTASNKSSSSVGKHSKR